MNSVTQSVTTDKRNDSSQVFFFFPELETKIERRASHAREKFEIAFLHSFH